MDRKSLDKMKISICIAMIALIGACCAMNVNRMDIPEEEGTLHQNDNVLFFEPQENQPNLGNNTSCKNPKYFCSDNRPCCERANATVPSCCPYPQGVCCPDGIHCCPRQSFCDMVNKRCFRQSYADSPIGEVLDMALISPMGLVEHIPDKPNLGNGTACKDPKYFCSGGPPCCEKPKGQNSTVPSCCPYPQGVCCPDGIHCCPRQSFCDMLHHRCYRKSNFQDFREEIFDMVVASNEGLTLQIPEKVVEESLTCPDGSKCPNGHTCCKDNTGTYACCPLPEAVCCDDQIHCCPNGHTCDSEVGKCNQGNSSVSLAVKKPSTPAEPELSAAEFDVSENASVPCPGGAVACPNQYTCCEILSGGYGCCPLPQAVCCADRVHCCPSGYRCDVAAGTCSKGNDVIAWVSKQATTPTKVIPKEISIFPDNSTCLDGETCCSGKQNSYACCPLPDAVCCSDRFHCCPKGYTCDVGIASCIKGSEVLSWASKVSTIPTEEPANDVTCPDQSTCPSGSTCCESQQGQYACCPLPKAVCCSDKIHCCPNDYTCDVAAGRCNKGSDFTALFTKQPAKAAANVKTVTCADQSTCPDGSTCCEDQQGGYACCPLLNATCCSDKLHCCPDGYTCDVGAGTCTQGNELLAWFTKQPAMPEPTEINVSCPDGSACPSGETCCKNQQGNYACCPLPKAVCCSDGLHCCPEDYTCDVSAGRCNKGQDTTALFKKHPVKAVAPTLKDVTCPDQSTCPSESTCCEDQEGHYGCCPMPQAVCCSDKLHCCPDGYTCDVEAGRCNMGKNFVKMFAKQPATPAPSMNDIVCPDKSVCPSGQTCCENQQGGYGCCPTQQAVCCSDKLHCCPAGYTCDVSAGACNRGNDIITMLTKQAATPAPADNEAVTCPDQSSCPSGETCCEDQQGGYACCPLPQAVCCSDKLHCCPKDYTCDVSAGRCNKGNEFLAIFSKRPATPKPVESNTVCPDQSSCPSGQTCCENQQGGYGCCPFPSAVCCSDKLHCCPAGYTCDVSAGTCNRGNDIITMLTKQAATPAPADNEAVTCPDQSSCPSGETCCEDQQGGYACCPLPQAVCCSDKLHCCPKDYTCDVSAGRCNKGNEFLAIFSKRPATPKPVESNTVCPDQSSCPSGQTCCQNQQGGYGCCPFPSAVCCSDKLHCCPKDYTCDVSAGRCNKGNEFLAIFSKRPATPKPVESNTVCPDQSSCPSGQTCCQNQQGGYGCCPFPSAVCCSDKLHCCPAGYTCDVSAGTCNRGNDIITMLTKQAATPAPADNEAVTCPDQSSCPSGETCCEDQQGGYACCPLPQAVCCSDKLHCCPKDYTCDVSAGRCNKGNEFLAIFSKRPATPKPVESNTVCPDQSSCPSGQTCCQNQQGGYGCCPFPSAVCCSDKLHCCPGGFTCDVAASRCIKVNDVLSLFSKQPSKPAPEVRAVTCADGSQCQSGMTCCEMEGGVYGCCPLPKAVCCSDKLHCCPHGWECDSGSCTALNSKLTITWFSKVPATKPVPAQSITCPDHSTCSEGSTCCEVGQGKYGCCPTVNATCCPDHIHCCPSGFRCNMFGSNCIKGNVATPWLTKLVAKPDALPYNNWCEIPNAVCCADKVHYCPQNTVCDLVNQKCIGSNNDEPLRMVGH